MENKSINFINQNKWLVVIYLIWFFLHLIFLLNGRYETIADGDFWPFTIGSSSSFLSDYDIFEFIFYVFFPIVLFIIYKLVGKDIKEFIQDKFDL